MKKLSFYILGIFGTTLISCSDLTNGFNKNPNEFTDVPSHLIIGQVELQSDLIMNTEGARTAGIFVDQFTGTERQYASLDLYSTISSDYNSLWERIYNLRAQSLIIQEKSSDNVIKGRAQMLEAMAIGEAAALFGDVPFSEANKPVEFPNPKYDSQANVLAAVQILLDQALTNVGTAVYQGSVLELKNGLGKYADAIHSLKARYYLIAKDYAKALTEAQAGINFQTGINLEIKHNEANNAENLFWQFGVEQRPGYLTVINSHWKKLLRGTTPRLLNSPANKYLDSLWLDGDDLNYSLDNGLFSINSPGTLINGIENNFILMEALFRTNQESAALARLNEFRAHIAHISGYANSASTSSGETLLKEILEEKYIFMPGSMQIFHDIRRTKNLINVPIKNASATKIPQRFIYPQTEKNANTNFPGFKDLFEETPINK